MPFAKVHRCPLSRVVEKTSTENSLNPTADVCRKKSSTSSLRHFPLSKDGYTFRLFHSAAELDEDWEAAQPPRNLYLQIPLLTALEAAPPIGMRFCYLVMFENGRPFGVVNCQIIKFETDQSVQDMEGSTKAPGLLKSVGVAVKNKVAKQFQFKLLVCGNLMLTGEHGFYFHSEKLNKKEFVHLVEEALEVTQSELKKKKIKTDGIFIKDIDENHVSCNEQLKSHAFREFLFHPNMVLNLRPEWKNFEDYKAALTSKYRVRIKKAIKEGQPFTKIEFTEEQIQNNLTRLYELYRKVMNSADFNMIVLPENYALELKKQLGDRFIVTGYYLDGELVGCRTNIVNYDEVEAHFLGYDASLNRKYKLYMNILIDSLNCGFENKAKRVVYARTAMEIKSSIGAEPEQLHGYIRANNKIINKIISPVLEYFRPPDDWVQRRPFKD